MDNKNDNVAEVDDFKEDQMFVEPAEHEEELEKAELISEESAVPVEAPSGAKTKEEYSKETEENFPVQKDINDKLESSIAKKKGFKDKFELEPETKEHKKGRHAVMLVFVLMMLVVILFFVSSTIMSKKDAQISLLTNMINNSKQTSQVEESPAPAKKKSMSPSREAEKPSPSKGASAEPAK